MSDAIRFNLGYYTRQYRFSIFHKRGDNPILFDFWIRYIRRQKKIGYLLEVGCGEGYFLKRISKYFTSFGTDISKDGAHNTKAIASNALFFISDAAKLSCKAGSFDVVVAFDIIEHLKNPENFVKEVFRVLKKDGILIIKTPNPASFGAKIKGDMWHGSIKRDSTHILVQDMGIWKELIGKSGFEIIEDGTDTLWDAPYFKIVPKFIQRCIFIFIHHIVTLYKGFYPWRWGENYICIAKKD